MKLNISVVTYKSDRDEINTLVKTCVKVPDIETVFVIDNSPNDELSVVADIASSVEYIHNPSNPGFGAAHNIAMEKTIERKIPYHLIVNPDIHFDPEVVAPLVSYMHDNVDIGVIMPQILYPTGEIQHLCKLLPTPMDLIGRRFIPFNREKLSWKYEMRWSGYDKIMEAPTLSGCFTCFKTSVLEDVGIFDDRYFMYLEDFDLFRRVGKVAKCIFYPEVSVIHDYGKGSYKNKKLLKYHIQSALKYFFKWGWFFDPFRKELNARVMKEFS